MHDTNRAHTFKADSAVDRLTAINPTLSYRAIKERLTADNAYELLQPFDLVLDCTDNFEARYVINDACVLLKIPYISGSAVGLEGQITVIIPHQTACYRCLYPNPSTAEACRSCANAGVLGPVPGLIGCLEATEAIKFLLKGLHHHPAEEATPSLASPKANQLQLLTGRQVFYDAATGDFFTFDLPPRNAQCAVCGDDPSFTSMADTKRFLDDFNQRTQCAVRDYRGDIPADHKLPIREFHRLLTQQQTTSTAAADHLVTHSPMLVVDVRSPIQFGIASLAQSPLIHEVYSSLPSVKDEEEDASAASAPVGVALINLPLAQLQSDDRLVEQLLERASASSSLGGGTLCVLCRRGVDSTVATRLLLERVASESRSGAGRSVRIWNVEGGLTAWHQDVDPTFPMY